MMINSLPLPKTFVKLLKENRWKRKFDKDILAQITHAGAPQDFTFYGVDTMRAETTSMVTLYEDEYGEICGLTHSESHDKSSNNNFLPVDKAIIIAGNWDEEVICLYYRYSLDTPKVVCFMGYWEVVADSFDEFATMLSIDLNT